MDSARLARYLLSILYRCVHTKNGSRPARPFAGCAPVPPRGRSANGLNDIICKVLYTPDLWRRPAMRPSGRIPRGRPRIAANGCRRSTRSDCQNGRLEKKDTIAVMRILGPPEPLACRVSPIFPATGGNAGDAAKKNTFRGQFATKCDSRPFRPGNRPCEKRLAPRFAGQTRVKTGENEETCRKQPVFSRILPATEMKDEAPKLPSLPRVKLQSKERKMISDNSLRRGPVHAAHAARRFARWRCVAKAGVLQIRGSKPTAQSSLAPLHLLPAKSLAQHLQPLRGLRAYFSFSLPPLSAVEKEVKIGDLPPLAGLILRAAAGIEAKRCLYRAFVSRPSLR